MIAKRSCPALEHWPYDFLPMWEVERLRVALDEWRAILSKRLNATDRYLLVLRHGAVITGAISGAEVPSSEEIAGFSEPCSGG